MKLSLRPVDTFTFRDHRDFNSGENSFGYSFPFPTPSTLYGALRSAYIYNHSTFDVFAKGADEDVKAWMGTPDSYGQFQVLGTFIEHEGTPYLPVPLDVQIVTKENQQTGKEVEYAVPLFLKKESPKASDGKSYRLVAQVDGKTSSAEGAYVSLSDYQKLLFNGEEVPVYRLSQWIAVEEKTGIMRDEKTRRTKEGMFYQLPMYRFKQMDKTTFTTYVGKAPSFEQTKFMRVGRKGRPWVIQPEEADLTIVTDDYQKQVETKINASGMAKLVFLTPTILENGTYSLIEGDRMLKINDSLEVEVLTLATVRPTVIGGYDIVKNRPKTRKNVIAAGTVVYVKVPKENVSAFVEAMKLHILTDDRVREGYGLCTVTFVSAKEEQ